MHQGFGKAMVTLQQMIYECERVVLKFFCQYGNIVITPTADRAEQLYIASLFIPYHKRKAEDPPL